MSQETPRLIQAIEAAVEKALVDLHTSLPAEIVSYDYDKNLAKVKPLLKRKFKGDEESIELPIISNVPIAFPRMGKGFLRFPVNPGDVGHVQFCERSIDAWLVNGGVIDPLDARKHSLSDAVFYPGLNPNSDPMESQAANDSIELKLNDSYFEILGSGKFKITNGTEELFDLLVQTMEKIIEEMTEQGTADFTNTIFGPQQPINFAKYNALKIAYKTLKSKLETLKG